jgi:heat shock protein HtpX
MSLSMLLRRISVFLLVLALPVALLGAALARVRGLIVAETLLFVFLFLAAIRSEIGILKIYAVREEEPLGARRSLERVLARMSGATAAKPRVRVFNDTVPQALVARGLGSSGSILLSEGLLGILSEQELRELLEACVTRLRGRGMVFQSLCAWMAHRVLELAPRSWIELLFGELRWSERLGALSALRFLALASIARFFVSLSKFTTPAVSFNAPHACGMLSQLTGDIVNPGSSALHLMDPWASRSLFPL